MPRGDEWDAFADESWDHVDDELVDFPLIQERANQPGSSHHPDILSGRGGSRLANAGIGSVTNSTAAGPARRGRREKM